MNTNNIDLTYIRKDGKHQVFLKDNLVGYIEKWDTIGWVFYQNEYSEWFGGLETLKETKNWLSEYNNNDYIINKIIKK
jgi:hypothetical protein